MQKRRKFEHVLGDLWGLLEHPARGTPDMDVSLAVWNLAHFTEELACEPTKLRPLLDFVHALRGSNVPRRQVAEGRLMERLITVAGLCLDRLEHAGFRRVARFPAADEVAREWQDTWLVLRAVHDFALACFDFTRPRDAFGGRRRALAFELLGPVGTLVDLPDVLVQARQAIRKAQSVEARQAAAFLQEYFQARDLSPDDDTVSDLLSLAEETASRSTAFQALNALVETHMISEFEALDRMDAWKSKRR
jgi:hypothetical protein